MTHPGGIHGDRGAPGGESSLRQGAGTASPGSPDFETAAAAEQRRDREKGLARFEGFRTRVNIGGRGQPWGHQGAQALVFYMVFREFIGHFKYWENLKYTKIAENRNWHLGALS